MNGFSKLEQELISLPSNHIDRPFGLLDSLQTSLKEMPQPSTSSLEALTISNSVKLISNTAKLPVTIKLHSWTTSSVAHQVGGVLSLPQLLTPVVHLHHTTAGLTQLTSLMSKITYQLHSLTTLALSSFTRPNSSEEDEETRDRPFLNIAYFSS